MHIHAYHRYTHSSCIHPRAAFTQCTICRAIDHRRPTKGVLGAYWHSESLVHSKQIDPLRLSPRNSSTRSLKLLSAAYLSGMKLDALHMQSASSPVSCPNVDFTDEMPECRKSGHLSNCHSKRYGWNPRLVFVLLLSSASFSHCSRSKHVGYSKVSVYNEPLLRPM